MPDFQNLMYNAVVAEIALWGGMGWGGGRGDPANCPPSPGFNQSVDVCTYNNGAEVLCGLSG